MASRSPASGPRLRPGFAAVSLAALVALGPSLATASGEKTIDWTEARKHWAFQPPRRAPLPTVRNRTWVQQPLDAFILARLEQNRLPPSPEADPRTLIRRVTYDLTGLPPTPEEVDAFVRESESERPKLSPRTDKSGQIRTSVTSPTPYPAAYERLVDRLLASPRFGERMASMWLPLARYAEDQAHQVGSDTKFFYPNAHLYRQWVIDAFNRDLPYDRFIRLQLAADRVEGAPPSDLAALGFLGLGPKYYNRNRIDVMADEWQDRVDTVTRTFLGLTVACARCHDHKYDPITQADYYALAGVFASTKMVNRAPDGKAEEGVEAAKMSKDTVHVVVDDTPHDLNVFLRGNVDSKGPVAPRRFLRVLSKDEPQPFQDGSGRRELAEAIAAPDNPLTSRVIVNRVWAEFFGVPLVSTPSNFGLIGDRPTHPELLDHLAWVFTQPSTSPGNDGEKERWSERGTETQDGLGWSIKALVRQIVLSSTYRQTSNPRSAQSADSSRPNTQHLTPNTDPSNRLLWRQNRRRLSVEQWRDGVLAVTGTLEAGGGPSQELLDPANHKRTLYARISRLKLNDLLMQMDYPDPNVHAEKRSVTTTPTQKLFLLNSPFILDQAKALAAKLTADPADGNAIRIQRAYQSLYGRAPGPDELRLGLDYLQKPENEGMTRWERYAQALLAANEMLYVD